MSKEEKQLSKKDSNRKYLVVNGKKIPFASPNASIYQNSATIVLRGKPITEKQKKEAKQKEKQLCNMFRKSLDCIVRQKLSEHLKSQNMNNFKNA